MGKAVLRKALQWVSDDYWNGWLYVYEPGANSPAPGAIRCGVIEELEEIACSPHPELRRQAWRREADAWAFGAWMESELAAVCWFQARETYRRRGGFFRLAADEAELVQITTAEKFRGRGIAKVLIEYAACQMGANGFRRLYAKVWHDNKPSIRAFQNAGWKLKSRFVSLRVRGKERPVIVRLPMASVV